MATLMDKLQTEARKRLNKVQDWIVDFEEKGGLDNVANRLGTVIREQEERLASGKHVMNPSYQSQVRLWYARLELPAGASADDVRQAYRTLMRKYHPDRFTGDAESERLATQVSQELSVAYEGLLDYLGS